MEIILADPQIYQCTLGFNITYIKKVFIRFTFII